jgi:hypothetical protein
MAFCLLPKQTDDFLAKLKDGSIDPEKLSNMSSSERHNFLGEIVGKDNALEVNKLFESKLLLKDQQRGLVTWAKKVSGITKEARRDIISRIERMETALSPKDEQGFLKDLVDTRLGVNVTSDEAKHIMELSKNIESASHIQDKNKMSPFGRATHELMDYIQEKTPNKKGIVEIAANIPSIQRAVQTGFDVSAIGRQGAAYFGRKEWFGATKRMAGYMKSSKNMDELAIKMYSDKNWDIISKFRKQLGLTNLGEKMTQREEQFASKLIKKIPGLNISERAYTGFLSDLRYHRFTNTINALEKRGIEMNDEALKSLAEEIAVGTGRGHLGALEPAANSLATVLFSPRWFASKIQIVSDPFRKNIPKPARIEAAKNLATMAGLATGLILGIRASGASVEIDPRSSDFGKLKVGNTRIDLTFGQGQYIRAIVQAATGTYKSTTTGEIKKLNTGEFGGRTSKDIIEDFLAGKAAPNISLIMDFAKHEDRNKNKLGIDWTNLGAEKNKNSLARVLNMYMPLVGNDSLDAFYDASGNTTEGIRQALLSFGLSEVGIGVQTYSGYQKDLEKAGLEDTRNIFERMIGKPVEPKIKNEYDFGKMLYNMTDKNATDQAKKTDLEIIKKINKNPADIKSILNKYFSEEEKGLKDKYSNSHRKMKRERFDRLDQLLKK